MDEQRFERTPANRVRQYRSEIDRILAALGHPEAFVTDESRLRDFPLREDDDGPSLTELRIDLGVRVRRDDRLVDIAQRMRAHAEALIRRAMPTARHTWVEWFGERDAQVLLLCLLQAIDRGTSIESLQRMVESWRENAHETLVVRSPGAGPVWRHPHARRPWGCPGRSPRVLTTRHTVDCAYTQQELQALFRLTHEADVEKGGRYVVYAPCDRLHSPPR
jgi:hypothetical protein